MRFEPTKYHLVNVGNGREFEDKGWTMGDPEGGAPSLVRAVYDNKRFTPRNDQDGIYRYADWMPIKRTLRKSCAPVTYKSKGLAQFLGLENLYITFSGWNPRIGAKMRTCSFKETEAYSVLARMDAREKRILIVQSAGNTARAFAQVCSDNRIPIVICVPEDSLHDLWFRRPLRSCVKLIAVPHGCDYYDAITLGEKLASDPRYMLEGGAKNVARRDGMGTTVLSCVEKMGRIPDAYFQAVGSGTGAIAAWTAASGRTGCACMWPRTILLRSCTIPGRPAPVRSWTWIPRRDGTRPKWSSPASFPTGNLRTAWPAACMTRSMPAAATSTSPATTISSTGSSSSGTGKGTTSFRLRA